MNAETLEVSPKFMLFVQHGWADNANDLAGMARRWLVPNEPSEYLIAPNLGWLNTWLPMEPMIRQIERTATEVWQNYPRLPWRIVAHSMGGVLWLEVLQRHPEWWSQVHSLVLIGSPVGGSHLAKLFDPLGWFPLVGRDLGRNRRMIAESIAAVIPTLSIVSNIGMDTDGLVALSSSWFRHAQYVELEGIRHSDLKYHAQVAAVIKDFWQYLPHQESVGRSLHDGITNHQTNYLAKLFPSEYLSKWKVSPDLSPLCEKNLVELHQLPLTDCDSTHYDKAATWHRLAPDLEIRVWQNQWRVTHIYLTDGDRFVYGGYSGWKDEKIIKLWLMRLRNCES